MTTQQARAVLWDMDGTLLDSAEFHWPAWRDTLALEDYTLSEDHFISTFGQRNDTILRDWLGADLSTSDIQRIGDVKEALYRQLVRERGVVLLPGVAHWLQQLRDDGWLQAVASAAPRANIEAIVDALDIRAYFVAFTSAEDVTRGKPDPQVFLLAAERVGVTPARCVVVEDAPAGVEAARRAGMKCIGVRSSHAVLAADIAVDSLADLPNQTFEQLLATNTGS